MTDQTATPRQSEIGLETHRLSQLFKEGQEVKVRFRWLNQILSTLFRRIPGLIQRDHSLQAVVKIAGSSGCAGSG
jgi:hypothetical protein